MPHYKADTGRPKLWKIIKAEDVPNYVIRATRKATLTNQEMKF